MTEVDQKKRRPPPITKEEKTETQVKPGKKENSGDGTPMRKGDAKTKKQRGDVPKMTCMGRQEKTDQNHLKARDWKT